MAKAVAQLVQITLLRRQQSIVAALSTTAPSSIRIKLATPAPIQPTEYQIVLAADSNQMALHQFALLVPLPITWPPTILAHSVLWQ
jgi:hypothetical protein